jgi:hypothetical protein
MLSACKPRNTHGLDEANWIIKIEAQTNDDCTCFNGPYLLQSWKLHRCVRSKRCSILIAPPLNFKWYIPVALASPDWKDESSNICSRHVWHLLWNLVVWPMAPIIKLAWPSNHWSFLELSRACLDIYIFCKDFKYFPFTLSSGSITYTTSTSKRLSVYIKEAKPDFNE